MRSYSLPKLGLEFGDLFGGYQDVVKKNYKSYWVTGEKDSIKLVVETPGLDKDTMEIESEGRYVRLFGTNNVSGETFSCDKTYSIPDGYTIENCKAEVRNGVTMIELMKKEQSKKIKVM